MSGIISDNLGRGSGLIKAAAGGVWAKISNTTVTGGAVSTVSIDGFVDAATYKCYRFIGKMKPDTNHVFPQIRMNISASADTGDNYFTNCPYSWNYANATGHMPYFNQYGGYSAYPGALDSPEKDRWSFGHNYNASDEWVKQSSSEFGYMDLVFFDGGASNDSHIVGHLTIDHRSAHSSVDSTRGTAVCMINGTWTENSNQGSGLTFFFSSGDIANDTNITLYGVKL